MQYEGEGEDNKKKGIPVANKGDEKELVQRIEVSDRLVNLESSEKGREMGKQDADFHVIRFYRKIRLTWIQGWGREWSTCRKGISVANKGDERELARRIETQERLVNKKRKQDEGEMMWEGKKKMQVKGSNTDPFLSAGDLQAG